MRARWGSCLLRIGAEISTGEYWSNDRSNARTTHAASRGSKRHRAGLSFRCSHLDVIWLDCRRSRSKASMRPVGSVASARPLERRRFAADAAACGSLLGFDELPRVVHRPLSLRSPHLRVGRRATLRSTSAASAAATLQTARLTTVSVLEPSRDACFEAVCAHPRLSLRPV